MAARDSLACVEVISSVAFSVTEIELKRFILPLATAIFIGKSLEISSHICLTYLLRFYFIFSFYLKLYLSIYVYLSFDFSFYL